MGKWWKIFLGGIATVMLTGCGHNVVSAGKGAYLGVVIPYAGDVGVKFAFGNMFNAVVRENAKANYEDNTKQTTSGQSGDTKTAALETDASIKAAIEVGNQVNGYTVKLKEAEAKNCGCSDKEAK